MGEIGRVAERQGGSAGIQDWESGIVPGDVAIDYRAEGIGWRVVTLRIGDQICEIEASSLSDVLGELLRAGLAMLAGARRTAIFASAEPGGSWIRLERETLRVRGGTAIHGVRVTVQPRDPLTGVDGDIEFDAVCHSPRALAEAIHAMAAPHFVDGARPTDPAALAALAGALVAVRAMAGDQASGTP